MEEVLSVLFSSKVLNAVDQFLRRLHKLKTLKRVLPVSKQAFIRDVTPYFEGVEDLATLLEPLFDYEYETVLEAIKAREAGIDTGIFDENEASAADAAGRPVARADELDFTRTSDQADASPNQQEQSENGGGDDLQAYDSDEDLLMSENAELDFEQVEGLQESDETQPMGTDTIEVTESTNVPHQSLPEQGSENGEKVANEFDYKASAAEKSLEPSTADTQSLPIKSETEFQTSTTEEKSKRSIADSEQLEISKEAVTDKETAKATIPMETLEEDMGNDVTEKSIPNSSMEKLQVWKENSLSSSLCTQHKTYNVWVGDLPLNVTKDQVKEAFSSLGTVSDVRVLTDKAVGKTKGFGFVHFAERTAQRAALKADFVPPVIEGRRCRVGASTEKVTLSIGNLPVATTADALLEKLAEWVGGDNISSLEVKDQGGKCRGFGLLQLVDQKTAFSCLRRLNAIKPRLSDRQLQVSLAEPEDEPAQQNNKTMYLSNLDRKITEKDIVAACAPFGAVVKVTISKDPTTRQSRGYGFVDFETRSEVLKAITCIHNTKIGENFVEAAAAKPRGPKQLMRRQGRSYDLLPAPSQPFAHRPSEGYPRRSYPNRHNENWSKFENSRRPDISSGYERDYWDDYSRNHSRDYERYYGREDNRGYHKDYNRGYGAYSGREYGADYGNAGEWSRYSRDGEYYQERGPIGLHDYDNYGSREYFYAGYGRSVDSSRPVSQRSRGMHEGSSRYRPY